MTVPDPPASKVRSRSKTAAAVEPDFGGRAAAVVGVSRTTGLGFLRLLRVGTDWVFVDVPIFESSTVGSAVGRDPGSAFVLVIAEV